jgi:hypothetical protein
VAITVTDTQGEFLLEAPEAGRYWIQAQNEFYQDLSRGPISFSGPDTLSVTLQLTPAPVDLSEIVVDVERRSPRLIQEGVYDRMTNGFGAYLDRERIEPRKGSPVSDLVALLPMVELWSDTLAGAVRVVFRKRQFESFRMTDSRRPPPCFPQVFLNGALLAPGGTVPGGLDQFPASDLEAIEVYESPAFLPSRFRGLNAHCGTIVLWTR